jgi:tRNA1Val (adenine37-N6)-methyltransferase
MSNHYFQFKQFRIEQKHCAMKVSTDACIQGAWTPILSQVNNVLDIGTGTGLLSLMMAQRNDKISIDAIELDKASANQAHENFQASSWKNRIQLFEGDVRSFAFEKKYDLIICNPPFFQNSLLGNKQERNKARHQLSLGFDDLLKAMNNHLNEDGYASVLLPFNEHQYWTQHLSKNAWSISHLLEIVPLKNKSANRIVSLCTLKPSVKTITDKLVIYEQQGSYSERFSQLISPFYL